MEIRGHSGKGISRVGLPWPILHGEVKLGELGSPSLLKGTQGGSSEMDQGVVVCEDIELGAQEVVTKLLCDCPFKGQEFQLHAGVVGLVLLCWTQPSTCVGQDPSLPILILREDGTQPVMAGVCLEDEGLGELCKPQDRSCSQGCLQLFERLLVLLVPQLGDVGPFLLVTCVALGDQVMEGTSNLREALDEASVVAGEAQKAAQSSSGRRHRPVLHSFHLPGLAADALSSGPGVVKTGTCPSSASDQRR